MEDYQISSDSIKLLFYDKKIEKIYLKSNPIIISKIDSIDFNQINQIDHTKIPCITHHS